MEQDNKIMQNEDLGQKLNAVLSDPERLQQLAGMANALASSGMLSGMLGGLDKKTEDEASDTSSNLPAASVSAKEDGGKDGMPTEIIRAASSRHSALLRALKPYLGEEKQARIDQMMRLLQLAELADTVLRGK